MIRTLSATLAPVRVPTLLALLATLAACSNAREVSPSEYASNFSETTGPSNAPGLLGDSGISFGGSKRTDKSDTGDSGIGVNAYLWRATLDTLSFMQLSSADPMGGVIITDWWQPNTTPRERFKMTAYILSRRLRADGLKMSIFRQVEQNGQWVDAPVNGSMVGEIEDKIIARARELRAPVAQR